MVSFTLSFSSVSLTKDGRFFLRSFSSAVRRVSPPTSAAIRVYQKGEVTRESAQYKKPSYTLGWKHHLVRPSQFFASVHLGGFFVYPVRSKLLQRAADTWRVWPLTGFIYAVLQMLHVNQPCPNKRGVSPLSGVLPRLLQILDAPSLPLRVREAPSQAFQATLSSVYPDTPLCSCLNHQGLPQGAH